jgi:pimeloyl-ACP methyl ester carboxylesterase
MSEEAYREAEGKLFAEYGVEAREHFVDIESPSTSVRVLEVGRGEPLVLVHGSPNNAATWIPLVSHLANRRCLLLERPGAGLSSPVAKWSNHRSESAGIIASVLDAMAVDQADLAGSSLGGLYAFNLALSAPQRVRSLILLGAPGGPSVLGMPPIFRVLSLPLPRFMAQKALRPDPDEAREMYEQIGHADSIAAGAIPDVNFEWYSSLLNNTRTLENLLGEIRSIATPFGLRKKNEITDADLARLTQPTLYLWGDHDSFAKPDNADKLAALTPQASIEHFASFGHLPWYDDPQLIAGRIEGFLTDRT